MAQKVSPFLEGRYGWDFGESGWNSGMDENLTKFSFMFDRNVEGVVDSLPPAINGQAYFLTTDSRLYFAVGSSWFSSPTPKWSTFTIKSTGVVYQFDGTSASVVKSVAQISDELVAIEATIDTLGSAAFEDVSAFATQGALDVVSSQANSYTDDLRTDLNSVDGSSFVGFKQNRLSSVVSGTVQSALDTVVSVNASGALGDGVTDDTAAVNSLIQAVAILGGGEIRFSPGRTYFIAGTILLPSNIKLNLCGATLKGAGTTVGTMFRTASLVGEVVTSNIGSAADTELVRYASVFGGFIRDVGLGFDLFNFVMGSSLKQLVFQNCRQAWKMQRCYYPTIEDVFASGGSDAAYPCYHFKDQSNAIVLTRVSCVMEFGFFVEGGCTAFTLNGATFEGGTKGFKFTGDCLGVAVNGGYFEAVPGTLFDVKEVGTGTFKFSGNYINYVDVVFDDGASTTAGPTLFGEWDSSNYLANIGGVTGGVTYRGRMVVSAIKNYIEYTLRADGLADQSIPANWITSPNTDIRKLTAKTGLAVGDFRQKAVYSGSSIIPMRRGGDVGPALDGSVFFASFTHGGGVVHVDTQINFRPNSLFAKFVFTVQDGNGISQVYGDLYGANVDKRSSSAITVSAVDNGGMLRLVLGITGALVQITGSVQICG
ncbi:MAG: putative pectate lyase superfamily protein [Prokaryotic dsDNA virus sp.]|nr:MAG: putative pectate lyase superfamily protein [Prokaryotic dsDNA virus sp.]|tara:strand:+ start:40436 stop:42394 length:1959 start_codon:yes stop_codon:yes gene_type:complete